MDDRTEPNLPNTEASVRFGEIQKYRTESFGHFFANFLDFFKKQLFFFKISFFKPEKCNKIQQIVKNVTKNTIKRGKLNIKEGTVISSTSMRFGSVLFGSVRLEYRSFGIRYFGILPDSVDHC